MTPLFAALILAAAPAGMVDVGALIPDAAIEMRYAGPDNFVGAPIDGYETNRCFLTREAADALKAVAAELRAEGRRLRLYDCYRPQRAVDHFVRWAKTGDERMKAAYYPNVPKAELFARGYIAERSGHSRGSTVDVTIDGADMGGPWDFFDDISHTDHSSLILASQRVERLRLKRVMERHGFRNYDKEWWHYTLVAEPFPDRYFDDPVR